MGKVPELTPEDLEKVRKLKGELEPRSNVSPEMFLLAEFGYFYGWEGVKAVESNEISLEKALELIHASRAVWNDKLYQTSVAMFYANKSGKDFNKGMKTIIRRSEVSDE